VMGVSHKERALLADRRWHPQQKNNQEASPAGFRHILVATELHNEITQSS
jgi:hypothetical protein